jgi:hypothetical protein
VFQISKTQTLAGCGTFEGNQTMVELLDNQMVVELVGNQTVVELVGNQTVVELLGNRKIGAVVVV